MKTIREHANRRRLSMGEAASELILRGSRYRIGTKTRDGLPVFEVPEDFPAVTDEMVRAVLEEE
ncbi:MAG TPA: hypothetical protein VEF06_14700 [Bryobacteraceae bacterium]|nr:hypothetical protein [Bryobacteraceae bacterium]